MVERTVGFVGTGQIGLPMARRLLDAKIDLTCYDVRREAVQPLLEAGARLATSALDLANSCEVVLTSLPSIESLREVIYGEAGLQTGAAMRVLVNTSTVGQPVVREIASTLAPRGVEVVDAPVSGGQLGAAAGSLSMMVSGTLATIEEIRPLLSILARAIIIAGTEPGAAQVLKLINSMISMVGVVAAAEGLIMGAKAGLDPEVILAALNAGSGRNSATEDKFPRTVLTRTFRQGSAIKIAVKDLDLAIEHGEALGVPLWVSQAGRMAFKYAMFEGDALEDMMTIVQHIERGARFEIPKTR